MWNAYHVSSGIGWVIGRQLIGNSRHSRFCKFHEQRSARYGLLYGSPLPMRKKNMSEVPSHLSHLLTAVPKATPKRVIGPKLRVLLVLVLGLFSLLMANGVYLAVITWLQHFTGEVYEDLFYQFMFLAHLLLGFVLIAPVIIFGFTHMQAAKNRRNRRAVKIGYSLLVIALIVRRLVRRA